MTLLQSDRSGGRWRYEFLSESDAHEQLHHDMLQILYWWCEATCVSSLKLAAAAPLASCVNPRANERKLPPEGNTAVVFCCSCCSFYSFFSSLVCLFSFVTFSTFSSRCYRSPVRVCCVRATLHHSRTNPPSLRSGCHRRPAAGDQREQPELTVIKHVMMFIKLLFLPSRQRTLGLPAACSLQRRMLSPQHHQRITLRHTQTAPLPDVTFKIISEISRIGNDLKCQSKSSLLLILHGRMNKNN